jgi:hypothetical protein
MPASAARAITLASEVIMQPKPTLVTLRPVLPRIRYVSLSSATGAADGMAGVPAVRGIAKPAAGSTRPPARKLRRDDFIWLPLNPRGVTARYWDIIGLGIHIVGQEFPDVSVFSA